MTLPCLILNQPSLCISCRSQTSPHCLFQTDCSRPPLHERTLLSDLLGAFELGLALGVELQGDVSVLLHVEELLEQLLDVVVGFGGRLHEVAAPALGLALALRGGHLPVLRLVALVPHQHDGDVGELGALHLLDDVPYRPQLLQGLPGGARVHEDEGVALGDGEALHGGELVGARRVRDLERADVLVAAYHLAVGVLDGGNVGLPEGALDEAQDQRGLAHAARSEHHDPVVIALLGHGEQSLRL